MKGRALNDHLFFLVYDNIRAFMFKIRDSGKNALIIKSNRGLKNR